LRIELAFDGFILLRQVTGAIENRTHTERTPSVAAIERNPPSD
jgi:hypothetical protein